jgi:hypothetical protein
LNAYRIERILNVEKDVASDGGFVVKAVVQGMHGHDEEPSMHGEMDLAVGSLGDGEVRFYKIKGKKREKVRIEKPDRFIYVIKGWLKKNEPVPAQ